MKKQFIAGNWKMNLTLEKARILARKLCDELADSEAVDVGVFPSFVYIKDICDILSDSNVFVGAQKGVGAVSVVGPPTAVRTHGPVAPVSVAPIHRCQSYIQQA